MMMICRWRGFADGDDNDGDDIDDTGDDDDDLQMVRTTTTGAGLPKGPFTASQLAPSFHQHHNCK